MTTMTQIGVRPGLPRPVRLVKLGENPTISMPGLGGLGGLGYFARIATGAASARERYVPTQPGALSGRRPGASTSLVFLILSPHQNKSYQDNPDHPDWSRPRRHFCGLGNVRLPGPPRPNYTHCLQNSPP